MMPAAVAPLIDFMIPTTRPDTRVRWSLIAWLFAISAVAYLDRVNISIAGQFMASEFHLTTQQLGALFSAFVLGYAVSQAPGGWLADRLGPRVVLALAGVWWGLFTSALTLFNGHVANLLAILIGLRFALGIGEAVMYPASNCVIAAWTPSAERGLANGLIFAGVGFGAGVTPPLITYLMVNYGWRSSFWVCSVLGLAVGVIWYVVARDTPACHPRLSESEAAFIRAGLPPAATKIKLPWSRILTDRNILVVSFSYFCYGYTAYIFFSWFFIYLNTVRKLDLKSSAFYSMLPFLAMASGSAGGGWISDRLSRAYGKRIGRYIFAALSLAAAGLFVAGSTQVSSASLASFVLAGGAGALYLSQSSYWSFSADIGGRSAGSVSGFMNMCSQFGGALTASATPAIASAFGWTASFLTAAVFCIAGACAWLLVKPQLNEISADSAGRALANPPRTPIAR
jgi:ACS family glucarate transporter-like MFS transporter